MIAPWMIYTVLVTLLIALAVLSGEGIFRRFGWPLRWLWCGGGGVALALSLAALVRVAAPGTPAAGDLPATDTGVRVSYEIPDPGGWVGRGEALAAGIVDGVYRAAARRNVDRPLIIGWTTASAGLLILMLWTLGRLRGLRGGWRPQRVDGVDLVVSNASGPAVVGLFDPVIVVPDWLLSEPAARRRLVIEHELQHRRARDHVTLALGCVAACLQPWNPGVWWMLRRLRLAVELDCDRRVLRTGASPRAYGLILLEIAGRSPAGLRGAPVPTLSDSRTHLERRIMAMTKRTSERGDLRLVAAAICGLVLSAGACTTDLPTAESIEAMDVATAVSAAENAGVVTLRENESPVFLIDSVIVDATVARGLAAGEIESIEIRKASMEDGSAGKEAAGVVFIATRALVTPTGAATKDSPRLLEVAGVPVTASVAESRPLMGTLRATEADARGPLLVIDGVIAPNTVTLRSLDKASIESVEVLKAQAAERLYDDPRAANGVIRIRTKQPR